MHWILHLTMKHLCKFPLVLYSLSRNLKVTPMHTGTDSRLTQARLLTSDRLLVFKSKNDRPSNLEETIAF